MAHSTAADFFVFIKWIDEKLVCQIGNEKQSSLLWYFLEESA